MQLKSINVRLEAELTTVKPSSYFDRHGMKWRGNNLYTILPIHSAEVIFHQRQLRKLKQEEILGGMLHQMDQSLDKCTVNDMFHLMQGAVVLVERYTLSSLRDFLYVELEKAEAILGGIASAFVSLK